MALSIHIRVFRRRDLRRILEIERAAFPGEAYTSRMFGELHQECGDLFFVAERSGRILGYMVTCANARKAEIVSIAVDPRRRKRGTGAELMEHSLVELGKRGVRRLELMVRPTNTVAVRFYRRFGFRRVGAVAHYYDDGGDAIRMTKTLVTRALRRGRSKQSQKN